ncbi:MAG: TRAP transporter substrate-binding protein DctP [Alphaproteobacteria bacterium]|jgi:TRAP-type C4-dicarboxylate transport system substrate-binding protein
MLKRKKILIAALAASVLGSLATGAVAEEVTLKAVSAFSTSNLLTSGFVDYIDAVNEAGKGVIQINLLGGPEVSGPREQPVGLRQGQFDMIYGPPGYYLGLFPEADLYYGTNTPMERRVNGHMKMLDGAFREKMNATVLGQMLGDIGVSLWLTQPPKRTESGGIDLTGLSVRSSPVYRDFITALGGTPVVMSGIGETYTALERGTVDATGMPLATIRDIKIQNLTKYNIQPDFLKTTMLVIANKEKFDSLSEEARQILSETAERIEEKTFHESEALNKAEAAALAAEGVVTIQLEGQAAKDYLGLYLKGPWTRAASNDSVIVDVKRARELAMDE